MNIKELTPKLRQVAEQYSEEYGIELTEDYLALKLQEEVGEFVQSYLQYSKRARQKGETKEEIKENFESELIDVLGMVLLLADRHKIDIEKGFKKKWLSKINFDYS